MHNRSHVKSFNSTKSAEEGEGIVTVTAIRQINNNSSKQLEINTTESGAGVTLDKGQSAGVDIWIPWCTSAGDFAGHHVYIAIPPSSITIVAMQLIQLWQNNNQVCFATDNQFHYSGQCVPTDCATGGDRKLIIVDDPSDPNKRRVLITVTTLG
jgi:hypothetical protein